MDFALELFLDSFPTLFDGAITTTQLTLLSVALGLALGVVFGPCRVSGTASLRWFAI